MSESTERAAAAAVIGGAALLGITPILVRISELGPQATNFWRFVFSMPVLAVLVLRARQPAAVLPHLRWLLFAGLLFGAELGLVTTALHLTTVANATLLCNMTPIFAAVFGWLLFRERLGTGVLMGAAMGLAGAALLAVARAQAGTGPAQTPTQGLLGDALSFASAVGYAGYLLIVRWIGARVATSAVVFWSTLSALVYALAASLVTGESLLPETWHGWLTVILLGFVVHASAQGLVAYGVGRLPIATSTVMLWIQPLVAAVISWLWFGEALAPLAFVAAGLVLGGVYVVQRARSKVMG